ncbi:MAG: S1C family serine protease, partial [Chloroflexota bacterium]
ELILTANHVVSRNEDITVILPDGSEIKADLLGRDPGSDLALLKLAEAKATPARFNGEPRVGQLVLAVGRPTTEGLQTSLGVVSALGGPTRTRRGGKLEGYIRTDAVPYPGFSGGPLVDTDGKVIGLNTSGLGQGASIAIPIEVAKKIADSLEKHGSVKRGYLGIRSQLVKLPNSAELGREQSTGLLIAGLEDDSPAAEGGVIVGDIIVGMNNNPVENHDELLGLLIGEIVANEADLEILRGGKVDSVKVTVAERKPRKRKGRRGKFNWSGRHHDGRSHGHHGHKR